MNSHRIAVILLTIVAHTPGAIAQNSAPACRKLKSPQAAEAIIQQISEATKNSQIQDQIKGLCLEDLILVSRGLGLKARIEFNSQKSKSVHKQQSFQLVEPIEMCDARDPNLPPNKKNDHFSDGEKLAVEKETISCLSTWLQSVKPGVEKAVARNQTHAVGAVAKPSSGGFQPKGENHQYDSLLPDASPSAIPSSPGGDGAR